MPILDEFCEALSEAINAYKNEKHVLNKPIPTHRLNDLDRLETILRDIHQEGNQNAVYLRGRMVEAINQIEVGLFGNILRAFDSELRKKLNSVLANPQYSKSMLKAKEAAEAKERQAAIMRDNAFIMGHLSGEKVISLIHQVESLEKTLKVEKNKVAELQMELEGKDEVIHTITARCEALKAENSLLRERLAANSENPSIGPSPNF